MNNIDFVVAIINQNWAPGMKILEVGCGPAFLRKHFNEDYTGCDITDENYSAEIPRDVDIVCSAEDLHFSANKFDIVIIKSALYLFDNYSKAINEAKRVLKFGGTLIVFDYNKKTQQNLQIKEGHQKYPCWTQFGLKSLLARSGFEKTKLWVADVKQPSLLKKPYHILRQEILGTWAIVSGKKQHEHNHIFN